MQQVQGRFSSTCTTFIGLKNDMANEGTTSTDTGTMQHRPMAVRATASNPAVLELPTILPSGVITGAPDVVPTNRGEE